MHSKVAMANKRDKNTQPASTNHPYQPNQGITNTMGPIIKSGPSNDWVEV